jgi:hypothetical protein
MEVTADHGLPFLEDAVLASEGDAVEPTGALPLVDRGILAPTVDIFVGRRASVSLACGGDPSVTENIVFRFVTYILCIVKRFRYG